MTSIGVVVTSLLWVGCAWGQALQRDGIQLTWEGQPLVLTGYSAYDEVARLRTSAEPGFAPERPSFDEAFATLADYSINLIRLFAINSWPDAARPDWVLTPFAIVSSRAEPSSCRALPVFDLRTWRDEAFNPLFFERLRALLAVAESHGQIVEIALFDHWGAGSSFYCACFDATCSEPVASCNCADCTNCVRELPWSINPFNPANNNLGIVEPGYALAFPTLYDLDHAIPGHPGRTYGDVVRGYVQRFARETRDFDNIIYETGNEMVDGDVDEIKAWHDQVALWLREVRPRAVVSANTNEANRGVYRDGHLDVVTLHGQGCLGDADHLTAVDSMLDDFGLPVIDDDDGTWNCGRDDPANVARWAELALGHCAHFNHKESMEALDLRDLAAIRDARDRIACDLEPPGPPSVIRAGFWESLPDADPAATPSAQVVAVVHAGEQPLGETRLCLPGGGCDVLLRDDGGGADFDDEDGISGAFFDVPEGLGGAPGRLVFELTAVGVQSQDGGLGQTAGRRALTWPYLLVRTDGMALGDYRPFGELHQPTPGAGLPAAGPRAQRPRVALGGFNRQRVTDTGGGPVEMTFSVRDPQGMATIEHVEVYLEGTLVATITDRVEYPRFEVALFTWSDTLPAGLQAGRYLMEAVAVDADGYVSTVWPYLTVEQVGCAAGADCDDGDPCTSSDRCGDDGVCAGTPYTCQADVCQASSRCDGSGGCQIENAPQGTACDDGDPTTSGDACDAAGVCQGALSGEAGGDSDAGGDWDAGGRDGGVDSPSADWGGVDGAASSDATSGTDSEGDGESGEANAEASGPKAEAACACVTPMGAGAGLSGMLWGGLVWWLAARRRRG